MMILHDIKLKPSLTWLSVALTSLLWIHQYAILFSTKLAVLYGYFKPPVCLQPVFLVS